MTAMKPPLYVGLSSFLKYHNKAKAGKVTKFNKWTPMDKPTKYAMNKIQRLAVASSSTNSHLNAAQTTIAVKKEDIAYTSASTAENQNVSENA